MASTICLNKDCWLSEGLCALKYLNTLQIITCSFEDVGFPFMFTCIAE